MFTQSVIYFLLWILVFMFTVTLRFLITLSDMSLKLGDKDLGNTFDYVIVGGGSAGAILASRLSKSSNVTVLLIEAGGDGFDFLNIPVLGPLKQGTDLDWQHSTVPQQFSCLALVKNTSKWPSGKILGGSTHLNYMIYLKGHKSDYQTWKDPESSHWSSNDINNYFKKSRKFVGPIFFKSDHKSYCDGSMLVRKEIPYTTELSEAILAAAAELKYEVNNLNVEGGTGFMKPELNMNEFGKRWTSDQYLKVILKDRKNLKVVTNAVAEEILLRDGFEAYAIRFQRFGKIETVFADVEVILSAGSVGSAKLLMLSGIGPENVLKEANIEPKINLPVGKNLQDHVTTGLDLVILNKTLFSFADLMLPSSAYNYFVHGEGPFTSGFVEAVGVIHSSLVDPSKDSPDLEFMVMPAGVSSDKGVLLRHSMGISEEAWDGFFSSLINESVVSILPVVLHPKSRGDVTLNAKSPGEKPNIDPKYLSWKEDVTTLVEGIRIIQRITKTAAMKNLGAKFNERRFPGCEFLEFDTDEYWECYVRQMTLTVYHPVGTCKMGKLEEGGVVDHRLRVHKTNRLRVIDASVMPTMPSANTNAAVVMIAEKGADLIKEDFHTRHSSCHVREILLALNICLCCLPSSLSIV